MRRHHDVAKGTSRGQDNAVTEQKPEYQEEIEDVNATLQRVGIDGRIVGDSHTCLPDGRVGTRRKVAAARHPGARFFGEVAPCGSLKQ